MVENSFTIRALGRDELSVVRDIANQTWPVSYREMIPMNQIHYMLDWMYSETALQRQMTEEKASFFLLTLNLKEIGFASCGPTDLKDTFKLHKLYVLPGSQRSGAGSALLHHCIDHAFAHGARQIYLQVNRRNPALEFYQKHGFSIHREEKFDIGEGYVMDDYIMINTITTQDAIQS